MKKLFLLLALAGLTLGAQAQKAQHARPQQPITRFMGRADIASKPLTGLTAQPRRAPRKAATITDGQPVAYTLSGIFYDGWGGAEYSSCAATVTKNGNDYTIKGLFPNYPDIEAVGTREGNKIKLDMEHICWDLDQTAYGYGVYHFQVGCTPDGEAFTPYSLLIDDATATITSDDASGYLACFSNDPEYGIEMWGYGYQVSMQPYDGPTEAVTVPEGAEEVGCIYSITDLDGAATAQKSTFYQLGDDYYLTGLFPGCVVKGTAQGDDVVIPSGQYLGTETGMYLFFQAATINPSADGQGYDVIGVDQLTLQRDDKGNLLPKDDVFAMAVTYDNSIQAYGNQLTIRLYLGDQPAKPVAVTYTACEFSPDAKYGENAIQYTLSNIGTKGEYLNTDHITLRYYYDDDPYFFDNSLYDELPESTYDIPYGQDSYNFWLSSNDQTLWLFDMLFDKIGTQVVYTVGGVEKVSDIAYLDKELNITIEPAGEEVTLSDFVTMLRNTLNEAKSLNFDAIAELPATALNVAESAALDVLTSKTTDQDAYVIANDNLQKAIADALQAGAVRAHNADAITSVEAAQSQGLRVYNLQGQQVSRAHKGVYIVNGKKIVVK